MKRIFTLAMLMLAFDAHAQQVHKCVDHRGNVAYQSQPCAAAQITARTWEAPPDPVSDRPAVPVAEPQRSTQGAYPKTKSRRSKQAEHQARPSRLRTPATPVLAKQPRPPASARLKESA